MEANKPIFRDNSNSASAVEPNRESRAKQTRNKNGGRCDPVLGVPAIHMSHQYHFSILATLLPLTDRSNQGLLAGQNSPPDRLAPAMPTLDEARTRSTSSRSIQRNQTIEWCKVADSRIPIHSVRSPFSVLICWYAVPTVLWMGACAW